jgi:CXXX repeat modification system protein
MELCRVKAQESKAIKQYYARMTGIKDLLIALSYHHEEDHHMLKKLTDDYIEAKGNYELWWEQIVEKYKLHAHKQEDLSVSFHDGSITLNKASGCSSCEGHISKL